MFLELAYGGVLLSEYIYHRWKDNHSVPTNKAEAFKVPQTEEGSVYPLIYGRCRVRRPVLAWISNRGGGTVDASADAFGVPAGSLFYGADMLFVVGIPVDNAGGAIKLFKVWSGDLHIPTIPAGTMAGHVYVDLEDLQGTGNHERNTRRGHLRYFPSPPSGFVHDGEIEFLNGNPDQELVGVGPSFTSKTYAADRMIADLGGTGPIAASAIPGYRNKTCVLFTRVPVDVFSDIDEWPDGFAFGFDPGALPAFNFEVWSTKQTTPIATAGSTVDSGDGSFEMNPIDVIYDLLTGRIGKLNISPAFVDRNGTFKAAADTLHDEGHGFSQAIEDRRPAEDHIADICRQIDAVLYVDPSDLKIKIKLIRGDYTADSLPQFSPAFGCRISNWALNGWAGVNKVIVKFTNRSKGYTPDSAHAVNAANTVEQGGQDVLELSFPGVCTRALAQRIAERELVMRSRPIAKCRITADRGYGNLVPGDVVSLTWPEYGIDGMLMRIAGVDRGDLRNGALHFDLIQDVFYVWRGDLTTPSLPPLPGTDPISE